MLVDSTPHFPSNSMAPQAKECSVRIGEPFHGSFFRSAGTQVESSG